MPDRTFIFAGGGTGGHLFPGIAVAEELLRREPEARILFAGSEREVERRILSSRGFAHVSLPVESTALLRRRPVSFAWRNLRALLAARRLLKTESPSAVVGLGGFVSFLPARAAIRRGIPLLLLEQNAVPGRATRRLCRSAAAIGSAYSEALALLPRTAATARVTGNPVRRDIAALHEQGARHRNAAAMLLVLGGSQGAVALNEAVLLAASRLPAELAGWQIVHQTGEGYDATVRARYEELGLRARVEPFFEQMAALYHGADIVISRAGGTTLAEIACAGCPALLVPYPHAVDDHQRRNAEVYESAGAARIILQQESPAATADRLESELRRLLDEAEALDAMRTAMRALARPQAAGEVVDLLLELAGR